MIIVIGIVSIISSVIAWRMVKGLDYMHKNHSDYKGEDLFDEDLKDEK